MRIISGIKKGKKILLPDPKITRPIRDSVKENIFNILLHSKDFKFSFQDSVVIDFFAGSGSFGMECLSRGSKFVSFVESNSSTQNTLFRNLDNNFLKENFEIKKQDFFEIDVISFIQNVNPDLIFFDPPYKIKGLEKIFMIIDRINIKNTTIILHIEKTTHIEFKNFEKKLEKKYGISKIIFLKN